MSGFSEKSLGKLIQRTLRCGIFLGMLSFAFGFAGRLFGAPSPEAFLRLGVLLLIMTPVARVAMLVYGYGRAGEYRFAAASAAILALLFVSVFI